MELREKMGLREKARQLVKEMGTDLFGICCPDCPFFDYDEWEEASPKERVEACSLCDELLGGIIE